MTIGIVRDGRAFLDSGFVLTNVFAHAHLAAVGWATMMVVGVEYRLLPMVIPARALSGLTVYASAVLIELGVLILFGLYLLFASPSDRSLRLAIA